MQRTIKQSRGLRGEVMVPGDKSVSHRALMIASLAEGVSEIEGLSNAADSRSTLNCLHALGIDSRIHQGRLMIHGDGLHAFRKPTRNLDAGNSGTTMRLLAGILSGQSFESIVVGDDSLSARPMKRVIEPLSKMGAKIVGTPTLTAPLRIQGTYPLQPIEYELPIPSAQVKSAILLAGLFAEGTTTIIERTLTRDHTERMLGLRTRRSNGAAIAEIDGGMRIEPKHFVIPGDISSAAFLIAAALLIPHSDLLLRNIGLNPTRTGILHIFRSMGGRLEIQNERLVHGEPVGDVHVLHSQLKNLNSLEGTAVAEMIDEVPILAVVGAFAEGEFRLQDAADLRNKESDRIRSIVSNLRNLRIDVEEYEDGFAFQGKSRLHGADLHSFGDHRIAMAFAVAGFTAQGETTIHDSDCVDISFPGFWETISQLNQT